MGGTFAQVLMQMDSIIKVSLKPVHLDFAFRLKNKGCDETE